MPGLEDYLFDMEALPDEAPSGQGAVALALAEAAATGTGGVTTPADGLSLPVLGATAAGDWRPAGTCPLPLPGGLATVAGWRPGWAAVALPAPDATGRDRPSVFAEAVLPPAFATGRPGMVGGALWPVVAADGFSGIVSKGGAVADLPPPAALAYACGLDNPVAAGTASDAVVALLGQGDPAVFRAARALAAGAVGDDVLAGALLAGVAGSLAYVADAGDVWTCAAGTYWRGTGDCEDGAILLHALLLAAGVPADRLVTAFGRVGVDRRGHAWVGYRRHGDGRWVALDWTLGAGQGGVDALPVLGESPTYALVDYALTHAAFFAVRATAAAFFSRLAADGVALPSLGLAGWAVHGARGSVSPESGWLTACGRTGAAGRAMLPRTRVAATAGWSLGAAALFPLAAVAAVGARGEAPAPVLRAEGAGAGGAQAACRLGMRVAGWAETAVLAAGVAALPAVRATGWGLAGLGGAGNCRPAAPPCLGRALPGRLAGGDAVCPPCRLDAVGRPVSTAWASCSLGGCRGCGWAGSAFGAACPAAGCVEEWR